MEAYVLDWANLLVRWLHVTAAIAWIGTSFYYIALDYHLLEPKNEQASKAGVAGEVWEIHGGGFYRVEKFKVAPERLPEPLRHFRRNQPRQNVDAAARRESDDDANRPVGKSLRPCRTGDQRGRHGTKDEATARR